MRRPAGSLDETMALADLELGVRILQEAALALIFNHGWSGRQVRRRLQWSRSTFAAILATNAGPHADRS